MQTELTQTILNKVPLLTEEQQQKVLALTETFLANEQTISGWDKLKKAIAENKINSGTGDLAARHDFYIYGADEQK